MLTVKIQKLLPVIAAQNWTLKDFSEKAEISPHTFLRIKRGKPIKIETAIRVAQALGLSGDDQWEKIFEWKE